MYEDVHLPKGLPEREPVLLWTGVLAVLVDASLAIAVLFGVMDAEVALKLAGIVTGALTALAGVLRGQVYAPATVHELVKETEDKAFSLGVLAETCAEDGPTVAEGC